ncbi:peptidase associated/transthyretin-like domain-containing protein [Hymenobacter psychrophilus]|uniref:Carboxypeptidase regulatory-like domain-containing protein n=1 Tax=Hymenobacter psychrophilus TaxID=651662 RepID=A0A1H3ILG1_9BACT|nr:hypothetical protein [Hymenobacter psychrophilus]SDY27664.1 hypothetical protein SAMN04488069_10737 [Hymenobacter psychrophilus]
MLAALSGTRIFARVLATSLLSLGLLSASPTSAQTTAVPLPATVPAYEPPPGRPFPVTPDEASAAAILTGLVVDEQGHPFAGAVLVIWKTKLGAETDSNGRYRLPVPASCLSRRGWVKIVAGQMGFVRQMLRLDARLAKQPVIRLVQNMRPLY